MKTQLLVNLLVVGVVEGQVVLAEEDRIEVLVVVQLSELKLECSFYCCI